MDTLTLANTIPFKPPIKEGRVIKVYDGDTITIGVILWDIAYRFSIRLNGIDTPELHGPDNDKAILARDALSNLIMNKIVSLKNIDTEKYGRVLADVYLDQLHVNQWMMDHGHAKEYHGGKKHKII
jgi:endonuclease YncB( thermonuclease family)